MSEVRWPDIWGEGLLFAFSGVDGDSNWSHHFVGSLLGDRPGVALHCRPDVIVSFEPRQGEITALRPRYVLGDAFEMDVELSTGVVAQCCLAFSNWQTLVGRCSSELELVTAPAWRETIQNACGHLALAREREAGGTRWALALHPTTAHLALELAHKAVRLPVESVLRERRSFVGRQSLGGTTAPTDERTYRKCVSVLKVNALSPEGRIARRWTTPDRWPHRHMWLWDSVFHAFGWQYLNQRWAQELLLALLESQEPDGRIPLSVKPEGENPLQSQPPIIAQGVWDVFERHGDADFLEACYEPLGRFIAWWFAERDRNENGLLEWWKDERDELCHCGESGMDNSPRFDQPGLDEAVDLNSYVVREMNLLARMAAALGKRDEEQQWRQHAAELAGLVNERLWNEEVGLYFDRRAADGEFVAIKTCASLAPLYAGIPPFERATRLVEHLTDPDEFWTPLPVPSVAVDEPTHSDDMWRGSSWLNYNYLIYRGLLEYGFRDEAAELRRRTMVQIQHWYEQRGAIYEFYDCQAAVEPYALHRKGGAGTEGGYGMGTVRDLGWTAAVYIALAHSAE